MLRTCGRAPRVHTLVPGFRFGLAATQLCPAVGLQLGTYRIPYLESFVRKVLRFNPSMPAACD
jgi:hypothetical protein